MFLVDPLREVLLFARSQPKAVTADDVAAALDVHRTVARSRLERLAEVGLLTPGFEPAVPDATDIQVTITTATCPLRPLVLANPAAAHIDRGLWTGLVKARLGGNCRIACGTHDCLDRGASCRVVLDFETTDGR